MLSFLTKALQSLIIAYETRGLDSELMKDGLKIQAFIAEMHGAQRRRIGWTEPTLIDEYRSNKTELAATLRHMDAQDGPDTTLALGILARLIEGRTPSPSGASPPVSTSHINRYLINHVQRRVSRRLN